MSEQVLPFYLVCDESGSMAALINDMNQSLQELHEEISTNPVVADKTRFAVIGFSDDAEVLLPLSDLSNIGEIPGLAPKGGTQFGAAFRALRSQIEKDVSMLKADGHQVYRPITFILTDGYPTDSDWTRAYDALIDPGFAAHPSIVAFGLGDSDAAVIQHIATFKAFMADGSLTPAKALREFAAALTKSIVRSGTGTASSGQATLVVEEQVPGFTSLPLDQV